jgi:hypothetical protein
MIRGFVALASRVSLLALLNCWAIVVGVVVAGGTLALAARLMGIVFLLFVIVIGAVVLLAYRKDGLSAWNAWVGDGATRHSMLILLAAFLSSAGGILVLQHGEDPFPAATWLLNLGAAVGVLETATVIMALIGPREAGRDQEHVT